MSKKQVKKKGEYVIIIRGDDEGFNINSNLKDEKIESKMFSCYWQVIQNRLEKEAKE